MGKWLKIQLIGFAVVFMGFMLFAIGMTGDELDVSGTPEVDTGLNYTFDREKVQAFLQNYPYLSDKLPTFERVAKKHNISVVLMIAIIIQETGGSSYALTELNNPSGQMTSEGLIHFDTLEQGLDMTGRTLDNLVNERGLNTLALLGSVYCPVGASNDPLGLNKNWVPNVQHFIDQMGGSLVNAPNAPPTGSGKAYDNKIVDKVLGTRVNNGQCYGFTAYYALALGGPKMMGSGFENASDIGSDYDWSSYGFTVINYPNASQLKAGDIVNWQQGGIAVTVYGHTGVITSVSKDGTFQTAEQNAEQGEIVALYLRSMSSGTIKSVVRKNK